MPIVTEGGNLRWMPAQRGLVQEDTDNPSDIIWYHGSAEKRDSMIKGDGMDGPGIYLTKDKKRAEMYGRRGTDAVDRDFHVHEVRVQVDPSKVWYYDKMYDLRHYTDKDWLKTWVDEYGEKAAFKNGQNARLLLGWDDNTELIKRGFDAMMSMVDLIVLNPNIIKSVDGKSQNTSESANQAAVSSPKLYEAVLRNYFHGTGSAFEKFTRPGTGKHGIGFYFTPSENEAKTFAKTLYGAGEGQKRPRVLKVQLTVTKPFNTMNIEHAQEVAKHFGFDYRIPRVVGGPKEHYHCLETQMKSLKIVTGPAGRSNCNEKIKEAGFDSIEYDFMKHMIVFSEDQIKIVGSYFLDESNQSQKMPELSESETNEYPLAGPLVDGRTYEGTVPNKGSIAATCDEYEVLKGIREVPMSDFGDPTSFFYAKNDFDKSKALAKEIAESKWIAPLIVVVESDGPYILEGAHRFVALHYLGAKSFPALVVIDESSQA